MFLFVFSCLLEWLVCPWFLACYCSRYIGKIDKINEDIFCSHRDKNMCTSQACILAYRVHTKHTCAHCAFLTTKSRFHGVICLCGLCLKVRLRRRCSKSKACKSSTNNSDIRLAGHRGGLFQDGLCAGWCTYPPAPHVALKLCSNCSSRS